MTATGNAEESTCTVFSCLGILISLTEEDGNECDKNLDDKNLCKYDAC